MGRTRAPPGREPGQRRHRAQPAWAAYGPSDQIGTGACGALLRTHLEANGARLVLAGPANVPTSRAIAHVDATGAASYRFELNWDVRDVRLADNSAGLHVGSLGMVLAPGGEQLRRLVEAVSRGETWSSALAHIVRMSDEDLAFLFPGTPGAPRQPAAEPRGRCHPAARRDTGTAQRRGGDPELLLLSGRHPDRGSGHGRCR